MTLFDEVRIDAPAGVVWDVTLDLERWPEWTPTITSVTRADAGPVRVGSAAKVRQPFQPAAVWTVTELDAGRRFAWTMARPGMRMTATHAIEPDGVATRNVLRLDADGALARLLWPVLRPAVRGALARENRGLKARCEAIARGAPGPVLT